MDSQWYYENHGRAQGPISTRELLNKLQKGELTLLDLVFREGQGEWKPLENFSEITSLMGTSSNIQKDSDWVILRAVEVDGQERFEQIGPFNVDHVMQLVEQGKIKFTDFVWKTGFDNWVPLGKVDKFDKPLASSVEVDLSLYKIPDHRILESDGVEIAPVKSYTPARPQVSREEPAPGDAKGEDMAAAQWAAIEKRQRDLAAQELAAKEAAAREVAAREAAAREEAAAEEMRQQLVAKEKELRLKQEKEREAREIAARAAEEQRRKAEHEQRERERAVAEQKARQQAQIEDEKRKQAELEKQLAAMKAQESEKAEHYKKQQMEAEMARQREKEQKRQHQEAAFRDRIRQEQEEKDRQLRARAAKVAEQQVNAASGLKVTVQAPAPLAPTPPPVVVEKLSSAPAVMRGPVVPEKSGLQIEAKEKIKESSKEALKESAKAVAKPQARPQVAQPPSPEAVERMRQRWQRAMMAVGCLAVVFGLGLFGMWGKKRFQSGSQEPNIVFEKHDMPEGVIPPLQKQPAPKVAQQPRPAPSPAPQAQTPPPNAALTTTMPAADPNAPGASVQGQPTSTAEAAESEVAAMNFGNGSFKHKSFFYHQERQFLFYTAQKGAKLSSDLTQLLKNGKNAAAWKKGYDLWSIQLKSTIGAISKELGKPKVYPDLHKRLRATMAQLETRGREFNSQVSQSRVPTKDATVNDVSSEFKKISEQARNLE